MNKHNRNLQNSQSSQQTAMFNSNFPQQDNSIQSQQNHSSSTAYQLNQKQDKQTKQYKPTTNNLAQIQTSSDQASSQKRGNQIQIQQICCSTCSTYPEQYISLNCGHCFCLPCLSVNYLSLKCNEKETISSNQLLQNISQQQQELKCETCQEKTLLDGQSMEALEQVITDMLDKMQTEEQEEDSQIDANRNTDQNFEENENIDNGDEFIIDDMQRQNNNQNKKQFQNVKNQSSQTKEQFQARQQSNQKIDEQDEDNAEDINAQSMQSRYQHQIDKQYQEYLKYQQSVRDSINRSESQASHSKQSGHGKKNNLNTPAAASNYNDYNSSNKIVNQKQQNLSSSKQKEEKRLYLQQKKLEQLQKELKIKKQTLNAIHLTSSQKRDVHKMNDNMTVTPKNQTQNQTYSLEQSQAKNRAIIKQQYSNISFQTFQQEDSQHATESIQQRTPQQKELHVATPPTHLSIELNSKDQVVVKKQQNQNLNFQKKNSSQKHQQHNRHENNNFKENSLQSSLKKELESRIQRQYETLHLLEEQIKKLSTQENDIKAEYKTYAQDAIHAIRDYEKRAYSALSSQNIQNKLNLDHIAQEVLDLVRIMQEILNDIGKCKREAEVAQLVQALEEVGQIERGLSDRVQSLQKHGQEDWTQGMGVLKEIRNAIYNSQLFDTQQQELQCQQQDKGQIQKMTKNNYDFSFNVANNSTQMHQNQNQEGLKKVSSLQQFHHQNSTQYQLTPPSQVSTLKFLNSKTNNAVSTLKPKYLRRVKSILNQEAEQYPYLKNVLQDFVAIPKSKSTVNLYNFNHKSSPIFTRKQLQYNNKDQLQSKINLNYSSKQRCVTEGVNFSIESKKSRSAINCKNQNYPMKRPFTFQYSGDKSHLEQKLFFKTRVSPFMFDCQSHPPVQLEAERKLVKKRFISWVNQSSLSRKLIKQQDAFNTTRNNASYAKIKL